MCSSSSQYKKKMAYSKARLLLTKYIGRLHNICQGVPELLMVKITGASTHLQMQLRFFLFLSVRVVIEGFELRIFIKYQSSQKKNSRLRALVFIAGGKENAQETFCGCKESIWCLKPCTGWFFIKGAYDLVLRPYRLQPCIC